MKKIYKVLAILLVMTMCLSLFSVSTLADVPEDVTEVEEVLDQEVTGDPEESSEEEIVSDAEGSDDVDDQDEILEPEAADETSAEVIAEESVVAEEPETFLGEPEKDEKKIVTDILVYVNPIYADIISDDDIARAEKEASANADERKSPENAAKSGYIDTLEEAGSILRNAMVARQSEASITFDSQTGYFAGMTYQKMFDDTIAEANAETDAANTGDYLRYQHGIISGSISVSTSYVRITFSPTYYTTADQEAAVTTRVAEVLAGLDLDGKAEDYKIAKIYDYITSHVVYDYDNLGNNNYLLQYTAYAALINGTSVCQGYANLFYRLCREAGLSVRIVSGLGDGGNHAWNIVRIGSLYYDVDSTWDAEKSPAEYSYFLKCDANFGNHVRGTFTGDIDYTSAEFYAEYPMSSTDYAYPESAKVAVTGVTLSSGQLIIQPGGSCRVTANVQPEDAYDRSISWSFPDWTVTKISTSYNNSRSRTITPAGDSGYIVVQATTNDGGFTATLTIVLAESAQITRRSIELEGNIGVDFYVTMPAEFVSSDGAYVDINGDQFDIPAAVSGNIYKFSYFVAAKQMRDDVVLSLYNDYGKYSLLDKEGVDITDTGCVFSVQDYFELAPEAYPEATNLLALLDATSDYGMYAQQYFEYNDDEIIISDNTQTAVAAMTISDLTAYAPVITLTEGTDLSYVSSTLTLNSGTNLRHYFKLTSGSIDDYTFLLDGAAVNAEVSGNFYFVEIPNIAAQDLENEHTLLVRNSSNEAIITLDDYSALSYVYRVLEKYENDTAWKNLVDLVKSLYLYYQAAETYFAS